MVKKWLGVSCLCIVFFVACQARNDQQLNPDELDKIDVQQTVDEVANEEFSFHVETEKATYHSDEAIILEAEITNTTDDTITLTHSATAINFNIEEKIRGYTIPYAVHEIGLTTELAPGESIVERYEKSGGYAEEDDDFYQAFMKGFLDKEGFPIGYYLVHAETDFYVKERDEYVNLQATVDFIVSDE